MTQSMRFGSGAGIRGAVILSMGVRAVGLAAGFVVHIMLSRFLGPEAYGRYAIVLGWALIFVIPTRAGMDSAALKFASLYHDEGDVGRLAAFQRFALAIMAGGSLIWAALGFGVALVSARTTGSAIHWSEVLSFAAMIFPLAAIGFFSTILRTGGRIAASQAYEQVLRPLTLMVGMIAIVAGTRQLTLSEALLVTVISLWGVLALQAIHAVNFSPIRGGGIDADDRRTWLGMGGTLLFIAAIQELMSQVDVILLGWAGQAESAALFSAAWRLASLVTFGLVAVGMIAATPIAVAYKQGDRRQLARVAGQAARLSALVAFLAAILINAEGTWLLGLFGPAFGPATPALAILCIGAVINAATGVVGYLLSMTGHEKDYLWIAIAALIANVFCNLVLVPTMGATGAALAATIGITILNVVSAFRVRARLGIDGTIFAPRIR